MSDGEDELARLPSDLTPKSPSGTLTAVSTRKQELHVAVDAADGTDPEAGLAAIGLLTRWLAEREEDLVLKARSRGWSWGQVAEPLGRSRQAVWERHRNADERKTK
jgi:hypothetical protein